MFHSRVYKCFKDGNFCLGSASLSQEEILCGWGREGRGQMRGAGSEMKPTPVDLMPGHTVGL